MCKLDSDSKDELYFENFTFIQAADPQIGFSDDISWGGKGLGKWCDDILYCKQLVDNINSLDPLPKFIVMCGDMVHAMPDGLTHPNDGGRLAVGIYSNIKSWESQNKAFLTTINKLKIPILYVPGNHDIGDRPTPESIYKYESIYGKSYYGIWIGKIRLIIINSQLFNDSIDAPIQQAKQENWLINELKLLKDNKIKDILIFQHQPWFINQENEETNYYNIDKNIRIKWLRKFKEAGVSKIFCGHYHRNACVYTDDRKIEIVVTSAIGKQLSINEVKSNEYIPNDISDIKNGMRIIHLIDGKLTHKYIEFKL